MMLGAPLTAYDQLGYVQPRTGNRSVNNAPRNVYQTARRRLGGRLDELAEHRRAGAARWSDEPTWSTSRGSRPAASAPSTPTSSTRPSAAGSPPASTDDVVAAFEEAQAAVGPVYDVRGVMADPQYQARGTA